MSATNEIDRQQTSTKGAGKVFVLPIALAVTLFAAMVYVQFSTILGKNTFPALIALGLGFYYCYAWHNRLAAKARSKEAAASKS